MILETIVAWAAQAIPHFSFFLILLVVSSPARVQRPAGEMVGPNNATGVLKAMDQLIRHNPKLEQHNQRLTNRIIALRQALAARRMLAHVTPPQKSYAPAMTNAPDTLSVQASVNNTNSAPQSTSQPGQAPSTTQTGTTDTCQQPEMRGEWNPGPGFKVAKIEKGELNLSVDVCHSPVNSMFGFYTGQLTDPDRYGWPNRVVLKTVL